VEDMAAPLDYPCPCCGYLVFGAPPGSYAICPICFWEDDRSQLRFVHTTGANHVSLVEGQRNYLAFGACEERGKAYVRLPLPEEQRDYEWRRSDPEVDDIEEPRRGVNYGNSYPEDTTTLYYWRSTYWRRHSAE
jgi:hypothetical protein